MWMVAYVAFVLLLAPAVGWWVFVWSVNARHGPGGYEHPKHCKLAAACMAAWVVVGLALLLVAP